jgi:two-component system LytT family response regulator
MIKAIIIDDEISVRNDLRNKLNTFFNKDIVLIGEAESVKNGVKLIDTLKPNLLLLDIELKDGTSFDLLNNINHSNFQIIFITGFNEHAIKAIKIGALDYILKPIDNDEFRNAIKKAIENSNEKSDINQLINVTNDYFKGVKNKRIVLKTLDTHFIVYEDDIIYCNSDGNYTTFYTNDQKKIMISKPLKKVEELISKNIFIKCHQSYLVNVNYIEQYKSEGYLYLSNNIKIPIASRRKEYVINRINNF